MTIHDSEDTRAVLRHVVATLAYRSAKTLRDVPASFANFSNGSNGRRPVQILEHLADLMAWGVGLAEGKFAWRAGGSGQWDTEIQRFFEGLKALDNALVSGAPLDARSAEQLIQGPLADAFTHVGQIALLRGAAGIPVRPESYARAEIVRGRVGPEQAAPGREFDGDASAHD